MSDAVRWGILSTARINEKFLAGAEAAAGAEVVAVASRDAERARRYADQRNIARAYGSYEELLADPGLDVIYISLPNALHVPWTLRALEAGKHVLCEKPLTRYAAEAERVAQAAAERGLVLSEAFMYRHHPQTARLLALLDEGRIGELRMVRAQFSFPLPPAGNVRLSGELEGGALMDVGCYCVQATRTLAGEPDAVSAMQVQGGEGVDLRTVGMLRCPDGVLAHFDCGIDVDNRYELEVVGSEGSLFVRDPWHCRHPGIELRRDRSAEHIAIPAVDPYRLEAENVCAAIRGTGSLLLDARDAVAQARVIEALFTSAATGHSAHPSG